LIHRRLNATLEQNLARLHALDFFAHILVATLQHFDQMPAKRRFDRFANLARLQSIHGLLKGGNGFAWREPPQVAALRRRGIIRITPRQVFEGLTVDDAFTQLQQALLGLFVAGDLVGTNQNVPSAGLCHQHRAAVHGHRPTGPDRNIRRCRALGALLWFAVRQYTEDVKALATAEHAGNFAGTQTLRRLYEQIGPTFDRPYT